MKTSTRTMPLAAAVAALTLFPAGAAFAQDAPPCVAQNEQGSPVAVPCPPEQQPAAEQPPAEQPPEEQPPAEQPPAEQPPAEQPPAEQPPEEQPPEEQPAAEQPPEEIGVLPGVVERDERPAPAGEEVEAAPVVRSAAQEQLPRTGTDAGVLAALGAAGVFAGVGAVVIGRRRRSEA